MFDDKTFNTEVIIKSLNHFTNSAYCVCKQARHIGQQHFWFDITNRSIDGRGKGWKNELWKEGISIEKSYKNTTP